MKYVLENQIKYEPKEKKLLEVNIPFYIFIIIFINCIIGKKSINITASRDDNYYSYFQNLERCLKEMKKLDNILKLDVKEISALNELLII